MKLTRNKSISTILKIFLIILFILCILSMIATPIFIEKGGDISFKQMIINGTLGINIIFIYLSSIPALIMLYQFIKIFAQLEKENVFSKVIEKRFLITAICSIIIGAIYVINAIVMPSKIINFDKSSIIVYLFFSIITSMIFLILGIGLMVLREIYKTAIKNKEENDLTI